MDSGSASLDTEAGVLLLAFLVAVGYEIVLIGLYGRTLGKRLMRIRVVKALDGSSAGMRKSTGRFLALWAVVIIPFFGFLISLALASPLLFNRTRQGVHDKAAGTVVIKT